jgi:hypothetical protein
MNVKMVKLDCRRAGYPQWLSFFICLGITEISEGLHVAGARRRSSTSQLEPLESRVAASGTRSHSPGIKKFKCIQP